MLSCFQSVCYELSIVTKEQQGFYFTTLEIGGEQRLRHTNPSSVFAIVIRS